jgi:hypothetical protein
MIGAKILLSLATLLVLAFGYLSSAHAMSCTDAFNRCTTLRTKGGETGKEASLWCDVKYRRCLRSGCWQLPGGGKRVCGMPRR